VRLDFRLYSTSDGWRIIDIYGKGTVSELALRRAEYDPILRSDGIEGLIEVVEEHTQRLAGSSRS
jgi:phospholipid transport system substrate-binding protein